MVLVMLLIMIIKLIRIHCLSMKRVNYTYSNQNYGYSNEENVVNMVAIKENDKDLNHPHNLALHFEVIIDRTLFRCVLIDGGVKLNICVFKILKKLGYLEEDIDSR